MIKYEPLFVLQQFRGFALHEPSWMKPEMFRLASAAASTIAATAAAQKKENPDPASAAVIAASTF